MGKTTRAYLAGLAVVTLVTVGACASTEPGAASIPTGAGATAPADPTGAAVPPGAAEPPVAGAPSATGIAPTAPTGEGEIPPVDEGLSDYEKELEASISEMLDSGMPPIQEPSAPPMDLPTLLPPLTGSATTPTSSARPSSSAGSPGQVGTERTSDAVASADELRTALESLGAQCEDPAPPDAGAGEYGDLSGFSCEYPEFELEAQAGYGSYTGAYRELFDSATALSSGPGLRTVTGITSDGAHAWFVDISGADDAVGPAAEQVQALLGGQIGEFS